MVWILRHLHSTQHLINHGQLINRTVLIRFDLKILSTFVELHWRISLAYTSKAWLTWKLLLLLPELRVWGQLPPWLRAWAWLAHANKTLKLKKHRKNNLRKTQTNWKKYCRSECWSAAVRTLNHHWLQPSCLAHGVKNAARKVKISQQCNRSEFSWKRLSEKFFKFRAFNPSYGWGFCSTQLDRDLATIAMATFKTSSTETRKISFRIDNVWLHFYYQACSQGVMAPDYKKLHQNFSG